MRIQSKSKRILFLVCSTFTLAGVLCAVDYWIKRALFLKAGPVSFGKALGFWLFIAGIWLLFTPLIMAASRTIRARATRIGYAVACHAVLAVIFAAAAAGIWTVVVLQVVTGGAAPLLDARELRVTFLYDFSTNVFAYLAIVVSTWGYDAVGRIQNRERRNAALQVTLARKEMEALKTQLRPHFLFNSLNSIVPLIYRDPEVAARMVVCLADLLRLSLQTDSSQMVPLQREIDALRLYVEIEKNRFPGRLDVSFQAEPDALAAQIPGLLLQPIVENAIRHGAMARPGPGAIDVRASIEDGCLAIGIRDDGPGFATTRTGGGSPGRGVGLANCRARLSILYGERHTFALTNRRDGGAEVKIRIPFVSAAEEAVRVS